MKMRVALVHDVLMPVRHYGGTERVLFWLAKGLQEKGISVTLIARPGSKFPYGRLQENIGAFLPDSYPDADIVHYVNTPAQEPRFPYLVTIHGNGKPGEKFLPNTSFVSRDHAKRHGSQTFVYNGLDPAEYRYSESKEKFLMFLAKASWRVKNVDGAIRIARRAGWPLHIVGGSRWYLPHWRGIHWEGFLGGEKKSEFLSRAQGLLFPVLWDEPFGLAVVEAFLSGTPVLGTPRGSLPELISPEVGALCNSDEEFLKAIEGLSAFSPRRCRDWAEANFHYRKMTEGYLNLYERILNREGI